jgi:hypothetical protein
MKTVSLLSFAAVTVAALASFLGDALLYAAVPCTFLVLIAAGDYGPKIRHRRFRTVAHPNRSNTRAAAAHPYRLAA